MSRRFLLRLGIPGLLVCLLVAVYAYWSPFSAAFVTAAPTSPTSTPPPSPTSATPPTPTTSSSNAAASNAAAPKPTNTPKPTPTAKSGHSQPECEDDIPEGKSNQGKCHGKAKDDDESEPGETSGSPDETTTPFTVGSNGVIAFGSQLTSNPASDRIVVTPDSGYALARLNTSNQTWQVVAKPNQPYPITQGNGTYALLACSVVAC